MDALIEDGVYTGIYIGKEVLGFKYNHEYRFKLSRNHINYELIAFNDITADEEINLYIVYSSVISIRANWIV